MIRRLLLIHILALIVVPLCAIQLPDAQHLIDLKTFESKNSFYVANQYSLDEATALLERTKGDRERLEALLFYLKVQFRFDISLGREQAHEALRLARKLKLRLHESMALGNIATASCLYVPSQTAHLYADSSIAISREIGELALTSGAYYTKYVIDLVNQNDVSAITNLLKCVELAELHASVETRNERRLRLFRFAKDNGNLALARNLIGKLDQENLSLENQLFFLIEKGQFYEKFGDSDSAKFYIDQAIKLRLDFETCYAMGQWYRDHDLLDSAIFYLNKSVELTDPRQSYIGDKYIILSEIYEQQGDYGRAELYLKMRLEESVRLVEKASEALNYAELAHFYLRREQLDSARKYGHLSYDLAGANDFGNSLYEATKALSTLYEQKGDPDIALAYSKELLSLEQSNTSQKIAEQLKKAEMDRNIDFWVQTSEEKLKRAEQMRNFIVVITILLLLLLISVMISLRNNRKALATQEVLNKKVTEQRDEIDQQRVRLQEMNSELSSTNDALEKKVAERTSEIKDANEKLTEYSGRLEEYANITAHNLRGPLVNIVGLANIYATGNMTSDDNHRVVELIIKSAGQIDDVMRELSDLLDVEKTREMKIEKINMSQLIQDLERWLREKARKAELHFNSHTTLSEVYSERTYLERTLRELLINAYHYRDNERPLNVNLTVEDKPGKMEIKVEDNGLGIDLKKYGNQIFMLNHRFHERNGRGVGLYLVKRQVEAMQGTVSVSSEPGSGACFTLVLPQLSQSGSD